jgi:hypothetical protein
MQKRTKLKKMCLTGPDWTVELSFVLSAGPVTPCSAGARRSPEAARYLDFGLNFAEIGTCSILYASGLC